MSFDDKNQRRDGDRRLRKRPATESDDPANSKPRTMTNLVSSRDYEELKKHYQFVLPSSSSIANHHQSMSSSQPTTAATNAAASSQAPQAMATHNNNDNTNFASSSVTNTTWQQRMVQQYHDHLYKEYVIADLSVPGKIGLRWRTRDEVVAGRGHDTCGNKHCPSFVTTQEERRRRHLEQPTANRHTDDGVKYQYEPQEQQPRNNDSSKPGHGLCDYEVPFQYVEHQQNKMELVKVRLCKICEPLLLERSRQQQNITKHKGEPSPSSSPSSNQRRYAARSSSSDSDSSSRTSSSGNQRDRKRHGERSHGDKKGERKRSRNRHRSKSHRDKDCLKSKRRRKHAK